MPSAAYREKNDRVEGGRLSTTFGYFSGKANRIELKQTKVRPSVFILHVFAPYKKLAGGCYWGRGRGEGIIPVKIE